MLSFTEISLLDGATECAGIPLKVDIGFIYTSLIALIITIITTQCIYFTKAVFSIAVAKTRPPSRDCHLVRVFPTNLRRLNSKLTIG